MKKKYNIEQIKKPKPNYFPPKKDKESKVTRRYILAFVSLVALAILLLGLLTNLL